MPLDVDLRGGPPSEPVDVLLQRRASVIANRRFVVIEKYVAKRPLCVQFLQTFLGEDVVFAERLRRDWRRWRGCGWRRWRCWGLCRRRRRWWGRGGRGSLF